MKLPVSQWHRQLHLAHLNVKKTSSGPITWHGSEVAKKRMQERCGNQTRCASPPSEEQETEATTHTGSDNRRWKMSPGPMSHKFCPDIPTAGSEAKQLENTGRYCLCQRFRLLLLCVALWRMFSWQTWTPLVPTKHCLNPTTYQSVVHPFMTTVDWSDANFQQDKATQISDQLKLVPTMPLWTNFCFW